MWESAKLIGIEDEPYVVRWSKMGVGLKDLYSSNSYFVISHYRFMLQKHAAEIADMLNAKGVYPKHVLKSLKLEKRHWSKFV